MKRYVVEGPAIAKLLQENRIRVQRGDLTFTPLAGDGEEAKPVVDTTSEDKVADVDKVVDDSKEPVVEDKEPDAEDSKEVEPDAEDTKEVKPEADAKKPVRKARK